jgi:hypothetical protein
LTTFNFYYSFLAIYIYIASEKKGCPAAPLFFLSILCCSQSSNNQQEDLARFGYKIHTKVKNLKHTSIILTTDLNHVYKSDKIS